MANVQKITPNLWFDNQAEEAVNYYCSVFSNSRVLRTSYFGKEGYEIHGMPEGTVMTIEFELDGMQFTALNGGPIFKFNEAVSFIINCKDQQEVDHYWDALTAGGDVKAQQCGWLKDKFGVSWQVVPEALAGFMAANDRAKAGRAMNAMLQMKKLDIAKLQQAFDGA